MNEIDIQTGEILSNETSFQHGGNLQELFEALAAAQAEAVDLKADESGYQNRYSYATLEQVVSKNRPIWTKHGISIAHIPTTTTHPDRTAVRVLVSHKGGGWFSEICEMNNVPTKGAQMSPQQQEGMVISYIRRYSLNGILQLAQEDDDARIKETPTQSSQTSQLKTDAKPDLSDVATLPGDATDNQKKAVLAIRKRDDVTDEQRGRLEAKLIAGISKSDASDIIGYYKKKDDSAKAAANENPPAEEDEELSWDG